MKLRLISVILFISPLLLSGQSASDVIFYSKGKMYVKYKEGTGVEQGESTSTALYIDGSAKFGTNASIVQKGRTDITGDFINAKDPDLVAVDANPRLFSSKNLAENDGVIAFVGAKDVQYIKGTRVAGEEKWVKQKVSNFIDFPTILVDKTMPEDLDTSPGVEFSYDWRKVGYVAVDTTAAIAVDYLWVPSQTKKNRFAVLAGFDSGSGKKDRLNSAHMLLRKVKTAGTTNIEGTDLATYAQLNLDMYHYDADQGEDDGAFTGAGTGVPATATAGGTLRNNELENYLTGFTTPLNLLGGDYFFYHTVTKPDKNSVTGWGGTLVDPFYRLEAGRGYFMSMEVSNADHQHIDDRWNFSATDNISADNRARGGYVFNRKIMEDYLAPGHATGTGNQKNFSRFAYVGSKVVPGTPANNYRDRHDYTSMERFVSDAVTVRLEPGFNFLGNPFMTPISLNCLLGLEYDGYLETGTTYPDIDDATAETGYEVPLLGLTGQNKVSTRYMSGDVTVRGKYWVINRATVKYSPQDNYYYYSVSYDYASRDGASTPAGDGDVNAIVPDKYLIAPMQMFCMQARTTVDVTLSPNLRTFGVTSFPKATSKSLLRDWFTVEAISSLDNTTDRTTVVFRDGARMESDDVYDAMKALDPELETYRPEKDATTYPMPTVSAVYTKSSDEKNMLGNAVLPKTKELALYFIPPMTQQTMKLKFHGLDNLESVPGVWLIDRFQDNKTVKLSPGYEYEFTSGPSDLSSDTNNRFILRFWGDDDDVIGTEEKPITCYYDRSVLHISGLNQDDIDSNVQIYDMQGRFIGKTKVDNAPSMEYVKPLSLGTYVLKITGKRNFTTKFVNLQN